MTLPSIQMLPSGFKTAKLYSQFPVSGNGDFTHSRVSVASRVDKDKFIKDVAIDEPRLDYTDDVCPTLLLEPQRTNLTQRSEEFDVASFWIKTAVTVSANSTISLSGERTADTLKRTSTGSNNIGNSLIQAATPTTYTLSIFIKKITASFVSLRLQGVFPNKADVSFDLDNNIITIAANTTAGFSNASAKIDTRYNNNWVRVELTATTSSDTLLSSFISARQTAGNIDSNDTSSTVSLFLWGAQLEQNTFSTSYMRTNTSSITRNIDITSNSGSITEINSLEGVLYVSIAALFNDGTSRSISISNGTRNNRVLIRYNAVNKQIEAIFEVGGVIQATLTNIVSDVTDFHKVALKYKLNDVALWIDGIEVATDSIAIVPAIDTLNILQFDDGAGSQNFHGKCNELRVYKEALTDLELKTLTT